MDPCAAGVVVDEAPYFEINDVPPSEIAAVEVFHGDPPLFPMEYGGATCGGVIIIWTKR